VTTWPRPSYKLAIPLFIREVSASFGYTHSQLCSEKVLEENLLQMGVTSMRVYGLSVGIYCCWVFSPMRVSEDNLCVSIVFVIACLSMILFMQLMC